VAAREDLEKVRRVLLDLAAKNQYCLDNPEPFFGVDNFSDSRIAVVFYLWFEKDGYWNLKNSIIMQIKKRFEDEGIEIPYQKIDVTINEERIHG
jgi:small-conductance mechanosensitive channel